MKTESEKVKIAVIGLGKIAIEKHIPNIQKSKDFELVATISPSGCVADIPGFTSLAELEESSIDIDAVAICTPPQPRFQIAIEAIKYGFDILLEKPTCSNSSEGESLFDAAKSAGVVVFSAWHSSFAPMVSSARAWVVENGCKHIEISWAENVNKWHPGQSWVAEKGGFGVLDAGINALSIVNVLIDDDLSLDDVKFLKPVNWETPTLTSFEIKSSDGLTGKASFSWEHEGPDIWEIKLFSGDKTLRLADGGHSIYGDGIPSCPVHQHKDEYSEIYEQFADLIKTRKSHFDIAPIRLVEMLQENALWREGPEFNIDSHK